MGNTPSTPVAPKSAIPARLASGAGGNRPAFSPLAIGSGSGGEAKDSTTNESAGAGGGNSGGASPASSAKGMVDDEPEPVTAAPASGGWGIMSLFSSPKAGAGDAAPGETPSRIGRGIDVPEEALRAQRLAEEALAEEKRVLTRSKEEARKEGVSFSDEDTDDDDDDNDDEEGEGEGEIPGDEDKDRKGGAGNTSAPPVSTNLAS